MKSVDSLPWNRGQQDPVQLMVRAFEVKLQGQRIFRFGRADRHTSMERGEQYQRTGEPLGTIDDGTDIVPRVDAKNERLIAR